MIELSDGDVATLRKSWTKLKTLGLKEIGLAVLFRLLTDNPQLQSFFYNVIVEGEEVTEENLRKNKKVAAHALRFVTSVSKILDSIEHRPKLEQCLAKLGESHQKLNIPKENFNLFGPALLKGFRALLCKLKEQDKDEELNIDATLDLWEKAYNQVIKVGITSAYEQ